jgi:putative ABC transport system substrate-binding protein
VITANAFFSGKSAELATLAPRYAMPSISPYREFVTGGGLMSYEAMLLSCTASSVSTPAASSRGEQPANLPVQQVTKVELAINPKTASAAYFAAVHESAFGTKRTLRG